MGVVVLVCKKSKLEWEMMEFNFEISGDKIGLLLQVPSNISQTSEFQETKVVTFRNRPTTSDGFPHQSEIHARSLEPHPIHRSWNLCASGPWTRWRCALFLGGSGMKVPPCDRDGIVSK